MTLRLNSLLRRWLIAKRKYRASTKQLGCVGWVYPKPLPTEYGSLMGFAWASLLTTDPFSSSSQPVNFFEIVLPGTTIGLGAWDLIGMFGGIPLFAWIGFGFVTRNGRTAKYETRLREANTRDELEGVARQWEYSLMLRLLGPHQGIRLERLRAELDDRYEAQNQRLSSIEPEPHDQTEMVPSKLE